MRIPIAFSARHSAAVLAITFILTVVGGWCLLNLPQDALPDWSDRQVIVLAAFDRGPELVGERVTRPISLALQSLPGVTGVRASSEYGLARVYATLDDSVSRENARTEILEVLNQLQPQLPEGVTPHLGPDANTTGWIYQYALVDRTGQHDLSQLRDLQDWTIRPALQKIAGIAEVASVGGFTSQFQVTVDPQKLLELSIPFDSVVMAIKAANTEALGRTLDFGGQRFMLRSPGQLDSLDDLRRVVLASPHISMEARMEHETNRPVLLNQIAEIQRGPDMRQAVAELNGDGEAVGGIIIARQGANAAAVIRDLKQRLERLRASFPKGVSLVPVYDRSKLIHEAVAGFGTDLVMTAFIVAVVILLFLWDTASALVAVLTIPICMCLSGLVLRPMHVDLNVATLTGLAVSMGVLVDGGIIQVENVHHTLRTAATSGISRAGVIVRAFEQVSPSVFLALGIIVIAFVPALALSGMEGRIFRPLVLAKTAVMSMAALTAVFTTPALRVVCGRLWPGRPQAGVEVSLNWITRPYERLLRLVLARPWVVVAAALLLVEFTLPAWMSLGSEFLPPFEEGSRLFMPITAPGISVNTAKNLIIGQDRVLRTIPEVESVFAKAGHADTATDPAPLEMIEANIELRPQREWRKHPRWYTDRVPDFLADHLLRPFWPDRITPDELQEEMDDAVHMPGVLNAWTSPIAGRADMLSSGARTPFVLKVTGESQSELKRLAEQIRKAVGSVPETRFAYAEPPENGFFLDVEFSRDKLTELGLPLNTAQMQLFPALSGVRATTIYEHSIPRSVYVRYPRDFRDTIDAIDALLIQDVNGESVRVGSIASVEPSVSPMMIRSEGGIPATYIYIDAAPASVTQYIRRVQGAIREQVLFPSGYSLEWSGRFSDALRLRGKLLWIVPLTFTLIAALLWIGTRSFFYTVLVCLACPFSLVGSVWFMLILHYKLSAASWVGLLALLGLDAETGIFMVLFLDLAWRRRIDADSLRTPLDLKEAVVEGAARRLRPKLMTVVAAFCGMLPIFFSQAAGADFMRRLIAPVCGGLVSSFALELLVYPAIFFLWRRGRLAKGSLAMLTR